MTPKEKAEELFKTFRSYLGANLMFTEDADEDAKQCVLIAVDEIIDQMKDPNIQYYGFVLYWEEVKKEIEKL